MMHGQQRQCPGKRGGFEKLDAFAEIRRECMADAAATGHASNGHTLAIVGEALADFHPAFEWPFVRRAIVGVRA